MQNNLMNIIEYIIRNGGAWWSTHYVRRSQKSEAQLWSIIFSFVGVHHFGVNCGRVSRIERYLDIYICSRILTTPSTRVEGNSGVFVFKPKDKMV